MKKFFVKNVDHNLEEAILDGKRTDVQLGHFNIILSQCLRLLWLTSLYLSRFHEKLLNFDLYIMKPVVE